MCDMAKNSRDDLPIQCMIEVKIMVRKIRMECPADLLSNASSCLSQFSTFLALKVGISGFFPVTPMQIFWQLFGSLSLYLDHSTVRRTRAIVARNPKTDLETNLSVYFKSLSSQALATNDDIAPN